MDTAAGRLEAEQAACWYADFNRRNGKEPTEGVAEAGYPTRPNGSTDKWDTMMLTTRLLPGYAEALASARAGLLTLFGQTKLVREAFQIARKHGEDMEFTNTLLYALVGDGDFSHGPALQDANIWHATQGTRDPFNRELIKRQAAAAKKPLPNGWCAPLGDITALQRTVVTLWVLLGLWLASSATAADVLNRASIPPTRGNKPVVFTEENINRIVSDLKLVRYKGEGRMVSDGAGGLVPDATLFAEMRRLCSTG